jgi:hypothetical protein
VVGMMAVADQNTDGPVDGGQPGHPETRGLRGTSASRVIRRSSST